jgi:hypothetical protein
MSPGLKTCNMRKFNFKTALVQNYGHWYSENRGIEYKMRMQKGEHKTQFEV